MTSDEQAIRDLLARRDDAVAAGDAAGAVVDMAEGAVCYDLPPPLEFVFDRDTAIAGLDAWFATWEDGVDSRMVDPVVRIDGDLAVAHGLGHMRGTQCDVGAVDSWFRATVVLVRRDGAWRIVHEHNSYPLNMDGSGTAATDLKPE